MDNANTIRNPPAKKQSNTNAVLILAGVSLPWFNTIPRQHNKGMQSDLTKRYALGSAADAGRYVARFPMGPIRDEKE